MPRADDDDVDFECTGDSGGGTLDNNDGGNYPALGQGASQDNAAADDDNNNPVDNDNKKGTMKNTSRMANTTTITTTTTNYKTMVLTEPVFALQHHVRQIRPTGVSIPQNKNCVGIELTN